MKRILSIFVNLCVSLNIFAQATSLTVDNQTPGWLSSKINYGDQQTLENLKVTGYINGTDIQFIYELNERSLTGVIDLEEVSMVKGGTLNDYPFTIKNDNEMPSPFFNKQKKHIQKFIYPKSLVKEAFTAFPKTEMVDSLIWTSTNVKSLRIDGIGYSEFVSLPEGVESVSQIPDGIRITFPNSLKEISGGPGSNITIYSNIENPQSVKSQFETYDSNNGHGYWNAIKNSTFYIPKGTMDNYLNSDFASMDSYRYENMHYTRIPNGNVFIEYYDIDSTVINVPTVIYKGETIQVNVNIYPNANLVSWIDYKSIDSKLISVNSQGEITALNYGQTEISATPHVFIDGLETKTGTSVVKVIAHTEGIEMPYSLLVHIGEEKQLEAFTLPVNYSDNQITYSTSDPSIAEVVDGGIVKGVNKGTCTITATSVDGGFTAECLVTVLQPVETIVLEKHSLTMKVGDSENLYAQVIPANTDNKKVIWYSSDEQLATVGENGEVAALKPGVVWIKAISEDNAEAKDSCKITITQPVTGIQLDKNVYQLNGIGGSFELSASVLPSDASNKDVKWSSSNESVCVVSNGVVVAVGEGTCVIIATTEDGGFIATCTVSVTDPTNIASIELGNNKSYQVYDVNGSKQTSIRKGINIIRFIDGTNIKVIIK